MYVEHSYLNSLKILLFYRLHHKLKFYENSFFGQCFVFKQHAKYNFLRILMN